MKKEFILGALLCFFSSLLGTFVMMKSSELRVESLELGKAYAKQESVNRESEIVNRKVGAIVPSTARISTRAKTETKSEKREPRTDNRKLITEKKKSPGNIILDAGVGYTVIGANNANNYDGKLKLHAEQGTGESDDKHVIIQPHDAMTGNTEYTLPAAYATANDQVLTSTTAGALSWTDKGGGCRATMQVMASYINVDGGVYETVVNVTGSSGVIHGIRWKGRLSTGSAYLQLTIDNQVVFTNILVYGTTYGYLADVFGNLTKSGSGDICGLNIEYADNFKLELKGGAAAHATADIWYGVD